MNLQQAKQFGESLAALKNPRQRRAFLDSSYAALKAGVIEECEAGAVEELARQLVMYGFEGHAHKLLTHVHYTHNALKIEAVCTFYAGVAAGHQTLSLGNRVINSGPDWSVSEPLSAYVVPFNGYEPGQLLTKLPDGAIPVKQFFANKAG